MIKFAFGVFILFCVFIVGSQALDHFFPSLATKVAWESPVGPVNWLLIGVCALVFGTYKMLK